MQMASGNCRDTQEVSAPHPWMHQNEHYRGCAVDMCGIGRWQLIVTVFYNQLVLPVVQAAGLHNGALCSTRTMLWLQ